MLTVGQAAERLGLSRRTLYRWVERARVHAIKPADAPLHLCWSSVLRWVTHGQRREPPADPRLAQVVEAIHTLYADPRLTLTRLSRQVHLSVSALSRRFKAEMGVGFRDYRRTLRLRRAEQLLSQSSLSIKQVALSVGYRHVGDFCRHFQQTYGFTPSTYRRMVTQVAQTAGESEPVHPQGSKTV